MQVNCEKTKGKRERFCLSRRLTKGKKEGIIKKISSKVEKRLIEERVKQIKAQLSAGNSYGEKVTLVAATKMQSAKDINRAILAGVDAVAENKVQEFRDKTANLLPCPQHFIGHLQTNKVKYLVGKIDLYHSCDRDALAEELAAQSLKQGVMSSVLVQINIGDEESKGGYAYEEGYDVAMRLAKRDGLCVKGLMAMLPESDDEKRLEELATKMRRLYERVKASLSTVEYLSMGMSGDYALCIRCGSNMVRVGSTIFGARIYE